MTQDATYSIIEHYNKTYEVTLKFESQRNGIFVLVFLAIGVAMFLTTNERLFIQAIDVVFRVATPNGADPAGGPPALPALAAPTLYFLWIFLKEIGVLSITYLMINLHHRAATVRRNYLYINDLEGEIRDRLEVAPDSVAFTRESTYYRAHRPAIYTLIKWTYALVLLVMVLAFTGLRLSADAPVAFNPTWLPAPDRAPQMANPLSDPSLERLIERCLAVFNGVLCAILLVVAVAYAVDLGRRPLLGARD